MGEGPKYIFVTGGVLSGLGKGLVSASVSKLLEEKDYQIATVKCDGYLNIDPGTMNPHEHGEVFVLKDGTEVDMDFGHYERFLDIEGKGDWNLTSGKIFRKVIERERKGEYLGKTVQMVPHVTDEIKNSWAKTAEEEKADIVAVEIGGTVGDMENQFYLEAARQLRSELDTKDTYLIHTTLVPYLETTGEQKTKPTQHSVKELRSKGLEPDMIVGRSREKLEENVKEKISLFCDVEKKEVISDPNLDSIYRLPLEFREQEVGELVCEKMNLKTDGVNLEDWRQKVENLVSGEELAEIAICGKYMEMDDSYASVEAALKHAAAELGGSVSIRNFSSEDIQPEEIEEVDGVIIPGGFGSRGIEGKIDIIKYCRKTNKPLLGLCLGMQLMVIEFSRNKLGINATSEEFDQEGKPVIAEMPEQKEVEEMGGTMRLGNYTAELKGMVKEIYGSKTVEERHRHRYEVDPGYHDKLEQAGMKITGLEKGSKLAEFIEIKGHPYFIGTQSHPEFNSSLEEPNPLYLEFLKKASK